ncbi:hypothetical protein ISU07_10265 [Nocardioides islandensis]|uniref:Uncharacterized protein n=1 Tax=Nocardioides islandensis TaxID=433663 RepID=A0A930YCT1_9ACTN|nr:hypothetical protein [Nocardioides islandensis]MBF4763511.1 hypothetical protein [Nocardioides islandensis]
MRPTALTELAGRLGTDASLAWSDLVARATAADTLALVHEEVAEVAEDIFGLWDRLSAEAQHGAEAAVGVAADLVAHFEHLTDEQLQGLTDTIQDTADELHAEALAEAGEPESPESPEDEAGNSLERQLVLDATTHIQGVARSGLAGLASGVGIDPLGVTQQARSIAGSLVPVPGLNQMVPEMAVVSLAASAGMRIRNGESVADVKQWLVDELSTIGVANAASVAVQLLSGMVFLRPLAVLGAKWGRARAETSAQATVAIRSAREKLAVLIPDGPSTSRGQSTQQSENAHELM